MNTSLAIIAGPLEAAEDDTLTEDALDTNPQVRELKTKIKALQENIAKITSAFDDMYVHLLERNPEIKAEIDKLHEEKVILEAMIRDMNSEQSFDYENSSEASGDDEEDDRAHEINIDEEEHEKACKSVYRKIASKVGPGRAKNKRQTEIFIRATKAYKRLDLSGLTAIRDELESGMSSLLKRLLMLINLLEAERLQLSIRYAEMCRGYDAQLYHMFITSPQHAESVFRREMQGKRDSMKGLIAALREELALRTS